jgi:hypothetical protein
MLGYCWGDKKWERRRERWRKITQFNCIFKKLSSWTPTTVKGLGRRKSQTFFTKDHIGPNQESGIAEDYA